MNIINIICFVSMYPVVFILYYFQKSTVVSHAKRGILFGISCAQWLPVQEREQILAAYLRQLKHYMYFFALLPLSTFLIPYISIVFTIWILWCFAVAIVQNLIPFAQGFNRVRKLKAMYTLPEETRDEALYELKDAGYVRTLHSRNLIPLIALNLGLIPLSMYYLHDTEFQSYSALFIVMAPCTLLLPICSLWMDRMKTQVISRDSDVNINYTRANKRLWKYFWLVSCWLTTIYSYFLLIYFMLLATSEEKGFAVLMGSSIAYMLLVFVLICWFLRKKVKLSRLYEDKQDFSLSDEDRGWIGGIIYYNPQDHHTLVSQKMGGGATFNLATPVGKGVTIAATLLTLLLVPALCIWLIRDEFTPIKLSLQEEALVAEHTDTEYTVPLEDIVSLTLLEELPKIRKVNGAGFPNMYSGTFRISQEGKVKVLLNPQLELFLRVETEDTIYYFSGYSDETTLDIYESLRESLP